MSRPAGTQRGGGKSYKDVRMQKREIITFPHYVDKKKPFHYV